MTIHCTRCKRGLEASTANFYLNSASPTGYQRECVDCQREMSATRTRAKRAVRLAEDQFDVMIEAVRHLDHEQMATLSAEIERRAR